jgi:hypothetical protein
MLRAKSMKIIDNLNSLPEDFHFRLTDLEIKLEKELLTHSQLKDLFELYTVKLN